MTTIGLAGATVLVTGASGAVGAAVSARLAREGARVRGMARTARSPGAADFAEWAEADLADPSSLVAAARGADLAVHCAATRSSDRAEAERVNVTGVAALADALIRAGCRLVVHVSTLSVYDEAAGTEVDEESPLQASPDETYGFTKAASERILRAAAGRGLGSVVLRPGMVLSMHPRSRWGPLALERARQSPGSILPFPEIPFVHVEHLADAIVRAVRNPTAHGRVYNAIDAVGDTSEYLSVVYGAIGRPVPAFPPDAPRSRYRADRIRSELGWSPPNRWAEFLRELGRWASPD